MEHEEGMSMERVIAVLGATGRTGGATVRHLRRRGAHVRALVRDPDGARSAPLRAAGVELVRADMDDEASLGAALAGVEALFNVQAAFDDRGRYRRAVELAQGTAVARAVGTAGVGHVVQLSAGRGAPTGVAHFDSKLEIREAFEAQGAVVTAIHPGPFMELMVDPTYAPAVSTWGVEPRVVGWDRPMPWVAVDDVGRVAADALIGPVPDTGSAVELIGDVRSLGSCRELLRRAGRRVRRVPMPTWVFRRVVGDELVEMWRWIDAVDEFPVTDGLADVPTWLAGLPG